MTAKEKVLIIDDEENLLNGLKRHLRGDFQVLTASDGRTALDLIERDGPIAVAISDMRMPAMDGVATLEAIEKRSPQTVRMMLTGNADQQTATDAINRGHIFRFFNKPCPPQELLIGIEEALKYYRLVNSEKQLLEQTLAGSVRVLIDVLGLIDPSLVKVSERAREWVLPVAKGLGLAHAWRLNLAVMLAPIGRIALPRELCEKRRTGAPLSEIEQQVVAAVPETTRDLITNIPRLAEVAEIVYLQEKNYDGSGFPEQAPGGTDIPLAARVLRILTELAEEAGPDDLTAHDFAPLEAWSGIRFDPDLLVRIKDILLPATAERRVPVKEMHLKVLYLQRGDLLCEDLYAPSGQFLLASGTRVSDAQIRSLKNIGKLSKADFMVRVHREIEPAITLSAIQGGAA